MKKLLPILTASAILLAACGNDNHEEKHSTHHEKKHKSENKEKEKNNSKKSSKNSSDSNNENKNNTNSSSVNNEQASNNNQTSNDNEELNSEQNNQNHVNQQPPAQTQTSQHQQSQATGYDPNNPYMNMPNQEWRKNTGTGLFSGEMQTKFMIENGQYDGDDGDQILEALEYYQNKYGN